METVIEFFFLGSKSLQTVTAVMRREWIPITVFLPAKSHEQRNLVGYSPWGSQKVGLMFNIQKMKIMASGPITS